MRDGRCAPAFRGSYRSRNDWFGPARGRLEDVCLCGWKDERNDRWRKVRIARDRGSAGGDGKEEAVAENLSTARRRDGFVRRDLRRRNDGVYRTTDRQRGAVSYWGRTLRAGHRQARSRVR